MKNTLTNWAQQGIENNLSSRGLKPCFLVSPISGCVTKRHNALSNDGPAKVELHPHVRKIYQNSFLSESSMTDLVPLKSESLLNSERK